MSAKLSINKIKINTVNSLKVEIPKMTSKHEHETNISKRRRVRRSRFTSQIYDTVTNTSQML